MSPKRADPGGAPRREQRQPLTAERVIAGAISLADEIGIEAFTLRKLADAIHVKPMTIYHHVPSKVAIIDGMVDAVFGKIELPSAELGWRPAILARSRSMRDVLARHPWAAPLMDNRTSPGAATLRHHDAVLGCFRRAGFSLALTGHAYATIDSFLYGFALQEASLPATAGAEVAELGAEMAEQMSADLFPHLAEFTAGHVLQSGYDFGNEFDFGLNLILDGLEAAADAER